MFKRSQLWAAKEDVSMLSADVWGRGEGPGALPLMAGSGEVQPHLLTPGQRPMVTESLCGSK